MIGIIYALISAFSKGSERIVHRYILADEDSLSYAFIWHVLTSLIFLPFFIIEFSLPTQGLAWVLVIISSVLWTLVAYFGFKAYSTLEVSVKVPIGQSRLLFALLLSVVFLKEVLTIEKILGTILVFIGLIIIKYKKGKKFGLLKDKGVIYTLISSLLTAVVLLIDKFSGQFFNPVVYSFLVYFLPAIIISPFVLKKKKEIKSILKKRFSATLGATVLGSGYYYFLLRAYQHAEASVVIPIVELGTVFAVIGGIIFLKERKNILRKVIASLLVIVGALLLSGIFA